MVVTAHQNDLVLDRKSIDRIGYEPNLYDFIENGSGSSIESELNERIETPFSKSLAWTKIESGNAARLDMADGLSIYGFAQHLLRRNLAALCFMKKRHADFLAGKMADFTEEEREIHQYIEEISGGPHTLFREGALETLLPEDAFAANVMICQSPVPFRTSTNPTLAISYPGRDSIFGEMFNSLRTWWLPLDRHWGAFIVVGGPAGFTKEEVSEDFARVLNRQYLSQLTLGNARYMIADDPFLEADLEWAGFAFEHSTTRGFRYRLRSD
ncbi:hypothetical protein GCM10011505_30640 [Tistrella bauzanensis]|uniref:Uncharacterized protein n=2 Tax=Tistrella bauzanensis TaxID=657419 RepID=A0ABQ1IMG4_9PROT|nr:hypothetical protein GCM10011505_30640 [Tistrella bauzanensis]